MTNNRMERKLDELKPCKCGHAVYISVMDGYYVYCEECGQLSDLYETRKELIEEWNKVN